MKVRIFTFPKICWVLFFVVGFWRLWLPVCWLLKLFFAKDVPWRVWWLLFVYSQLRVCACSVVSDSLRLCGLWSARILCPWDSPGKNTGVSCHFLLQGIFPNQGWNPRLLCLLRRKACSSPLVPPGKPWVWAKSGRWVKNREAWRAAVYRVAKSWTQLSDWTTVVKDKSIRAVFQQRLFTLCLCVTFGNSVSISDFSLLYFVTVIRHPWSLMWLW